MTVNVAAKYDLGAIMAETMDAKKASDAFAKLHKLAFDLHSKVDAIEAEAKKADKVKVENPLETKFGKDEAGAKAAMTSLRIDGGVLDAIVEYIDDDAAKTFHMLNAMESVVKFLRAERDWHNSKLITKAPKASRKAEYKTDYNGLLALIARLAGNANSLGFDLNSVQSLTLDKNGKDYRSILTGYRGVKGGDDGTVTGRYAKVYSLAFVIDDEYIEQPWAISDIARYFWHGTDRVGKNAKSVTDILDKECPDWMKPEFTEGSFTVNGHSVTISRSSDDDD